ncbi:MAG: coproporphyrinogen dehydrogenase HemZ [Clostridia bacterium]|nr:coproporphyrinogen dehydrogenase HemZ [Clostridia bacterium]
MEILCETEARRLFCYHLAQAFFHGEAADFSIAASLFENKVRISLGKKEKSAAFEAEIDLSLHGERGRGENAALGLAFAKAARDFTAYVPPYGTLIGVRPVKVARFYLKRFSFDGDCVKTLLQREFLVAEEKAALLTELALLEEEFDRSLSQGDSMLYLSIPFCPSRCSYCSFISSAAPSHLALIPRYLEQMKQEISLTARVIEKRKGSLRAVYMGGGTPGILSAEQLRDVLSHLKKEGLGQAEEYCVELGRPDTVNREKLEALKEAGVNRISINPQTTCDETLSLIGRHHTAKDFFDAMALAKEYDFAVNCDLISALPGETPDVFLRSVKEVLALESANVTLHALCKKKSATDRESRAFSTAFQEAVSHAHRLCINAGLRPYYLYRQKMTEGDLENLGFARPGTIGAYNLAMMEDLCDIFACGAGGISKLLPREAGGRIRRFSNYKYPFEYLDHPEKIRENLEEMDSL